MSEVPVEFVPIEVEGYRAEMERLLAGLGLPVENLSFVDDTGRTAGPERVSRCTKIEGRIFFKKTISAGDFEQTMASLHQFEEKEKAALKDPWAFVKHRLLHEISHIQSRYMDEYACNKWAFYQMKKL